MSGAADGVKFIVYKKPCGTRLVCTYTARDFSGDGIKHIARTVFCGLFCFYVSRASRLMLLASSFLMSGIS